MNPNAVIYLHEHRSEGRAQIDYELCALAHHLCLNESRMTCLIWPVHTGWGEGGKRKMIVRKDDTADRLVARILQIARDPMKADEGEAPGVATTSSSSSSSNNDGADGQSAPGGADAGRLPNGNAAPPTSITGASSPTAAAVGQQLA
jgi:hypothetical protein